MRRLLTVLLLISNCCGDVNVTGYTGSKPAGLRFTALMGTNRVAGKGALYEL